MMIFEILKKDKKGMALIIVLTASFLALVMIGVGASLLSGNLDKLASVVNRNKSNENIQSGFERVRALGKVSPAYLASCTTGDCIDTTNATCVACANGVIDLGNGNQQKVEITGITQPTAGEEGTVAGSVNILVTGYYKNLASQRSFTSCLNYCTVAGRNCGDNGCGGICGTCSEPETCETGICTAQTTSCEDINMECGDECSVGAVCGGGTVVEENTNIVVIGGGCQNTNGDGCNSGVDTYTDVWDNTGGHYLETGAVNNKEGEINLGTLLDLDPDLLTWPAVKFCSELTFNGFSDWYLPSTTELQGLNDLWQLSSLNNFAESCYWSSTETAPEVATVQDFSLPLSGVCSNPGEKSETNYIRCMRRY